MTAGAGINHGARPDLWHREGPLKVEIKEVTQFLSQYRKLIDRMDKCLDVIQYAAVPLQPFLCGC